MLTIIIDGTSWNGGQRLDTGKRTHLVLASGKLVQQKTLTRLSNFIKALAKRVKLFLAIYSLTILAKQE